MPAQFAPNAPRERDPNYVAFQNTDLRDGRGAPGNSMLPKGKADDLRYIRELAHNLDQARFDSIEVGTPIGGKLETDILKACVQETRHTVITAFTLAHLTNKPGSERSILASMNALEESGALKQNRGRISLLVSTSPDLRDVSLGGIDKKTLIESARASGEMIVREFAKRGAFPNIQYYCEGATTTEPDVLFAVNRDILRGIYETAKKEGIDWRDITTVCSLPDTFGVAVLDKYGRLFSETRRRVKEINQYGVIQSAHCHNDYENAAANTMWAIKHGARQAEGTTLGIGERTGNAHLSPVIAQLMDNPDEFNGVTFGVKPKKLHACAITVEKATRNPIEKTKTIHGSSSNKTSNGIHGNISGDHPDVYNRNNVTRFGVPRVLVTLSNVSGKNMVKKELRRFGVRIDNATVQALTDRLRDHETEELDIFEFVKQYIETRPDLVRGFEAEDIADGGMSVKKKHFVLRSVGGKNTAKFRIGANGTELSDPIEAITKGGGPVNAILRAFEDYLGKKLSFTQYNEQVNQFGDSDAEVVVGLNLKMGRKIRRGFGASDNHDLAAAKAIANALSRMNHK